MSERFSARALRRRVTGIAYIVLMLAYLAWRLTIINPDSLTLSLTYYAAEVMGFILGLTVIFSSWTYGHRVSPPAKHGLSVDVFVPAYKEPLAIIRRTLIAARAISYPHGTFLLDDGRRDELRELARELGITYLSREQNTNAKAGNLNFGLAHSRADFAAVFDADHIPRPHALDAVLGFFGDPAVAMVQAPQDYYNTDAFQYLSARKSGELWHDQSFFYNIAQPCREAFNGASCAGTSAVYRRSALDAIGGIPEETVTEDLHTSLKLHKAGGKVVYLNEPIAYGAAAVDISEYYKTRHRWAHGNIHALRIENAAFTPQLTLLQKLSYLTLGLIYLEGWQQLLLFIVPIAALLFGLPPFQISVFNVLIVLAFPFVTHLLLQELGCGFSRYWANEIFAMARFPVHIAAAVALVRGRMAWRSSSKAMKGHVSWPLLAPQLAVAVAGLAALAAGIHRLAEGDFATGPIAQAALLIVAKALRLAGIEVTWIDFGKPVEWFDVMTTGYTVDLVAVAGFWALFNCARAALVVAKAVRTARNTNEEFRFEVPLVLTLQQHGRQIPASVTRTCESIVEFTLHRSAVLSASSAAAGLLYLPDGPVPVSLHQISAVGITQDRRKFEATYDWRQGEDRDRLGHCLYAVDWHRELRGRSAYFSTPIDVFSRILRLDFAGLRATLPWSPILIGAGPGKSPQLAAMRPRRGGSCAFDLATHSELSIGTTLQILAPCNPEITGARFELAANAAAGPNMDSAANRRYIIHRYRREDSLVAGPGGPRVGARAAAVNSANR